MDPYAVLGVPAGASEHEVADAYRRLAKRHHPDVTPTEDGGAMATVNVAYDMLRSSFRHRRPNQRRPRTPSRTAPGAWLSDAVRRALGGELLRTLAPREDVHIVTPAATWASPHTLLVATDRRLLWLLDDAPVHRVRFLRFRDVEDVGFSRRWPRRRRATLRVRTTSGRRLNFAELHPLTAEAIARRIAAGAVARD